MSKVLLNAAEIIFTTHGVEENFRLDGRERRDYRPIELETDFLPQSMGSVRMRLANTNVVVGVSMDLDEPLSHKADEGKIEFFVNCSANATPAFEGRGGDNLATEITSSLMAAYNSNEAFNLRSLSVIYNRVCWKLNVDILILECGGNLFDAVSLAVKAALYNTQVPSIKAIVLDGGETEVEISDDPAEFRRLHVDDAPVMVTLCKIGEYCVVDPSSTEEQCSSCSIVIAVCRDRCFSINKQGVGSLHPLTFIEILEFGANVAGIINNSLMDALIRNENVKSIK